MLEAEIRWVDGVVIDSLRRTQVRSVREHSEHFGPGTRISRPILM
jgi:hypothetical protein